MTNSDYLQSRLESDFLSPAVLCLSASCAWELFRHAKRLSASKINIPSLASSRHRRKSKFHEDKRALWWNIVGPRSGCFPSPNLQRMRGVFGSIVVSSCRVTTKVIEPPVGESCCDIRNLVMAERGGRKKVESNWICRSGCRAICIFECFGKWKVLMGLRRSVLGAWLMDGFETERVESCSRNIVISLSHSLFDAN